MSDSNTDLNVQKADVIPPKRRRRNHSFQMTLSFTKTKGRSGDTFFVSHDIGTDGAIYVDLSKLVFLFFPDREGSLPQMVIKPRDFSEEDDG